MASTLPSIALACCEPSCAEPLTVNVPGPEGDAGAAGATGAAGAAAYTTFTAAFVMPAELGSAVATVANTSFLAVNQIVYAAKTDGSVQGVFQVTAIGGATAVTLKNLEDTATGAYSANSAPGTTFTIGSMLVPSGSQGQQANVSGSAIAGDITGTVGATLITKNSALGATLVGNGTSAQSLAKGTDGQIFVSDAAAALDLQWKSLLPITGGTDVADNRILRLDSTTGLPIPGQSSRVEISDTGAIAAVGSQVGGFLGAVRGTNAVDLQVTRGGAGQVASGNRAFIGAGENNTASGTETVVVGGDTNSATAIQAAVVGGHDNSATAEAAFVGGGDTNIASAQEATIGGGNSNEASGVQSAIAGGDNNTAGPGEEAFVGGGGDNVASGTRSVISGGKNNAASAEVSHISGGIQAVANKYGQSAWSSGGFGGGQGTAQASKLVMRNVTTNATPTELFLDGAALRCTITAGQSWLFQISVVARTAAGLDGVYTSVGVIRNNAGVTTVSGVTTTVVFDDATFPATPVAVTADDPNDALIITVIGIAVTTIRWVASIMLTEVLH